MKVLTSEQMQTIDRRTIEEIGIPGVVLMENAGRGVAEEVVRRFSSTDAARALVLSGKGNNGGDGYVVARHLLDSGWQVQTLVLGSRDAVGGDAKINLVALENCGGGIAYAEDAAGLDGFLTCCGDFTVLIDALLGTGLCNEVAGLFRSAIEWLNTQNAPVVAVDIPSGIDASNGRVLGSAVRATLTTTFAYPKIGLISYPGAGYVGELVVVDIGVPALVARDVPDDCLLIGKAEARQLLPLRSLAGHKGTFGHLLVVSGSRGKCGAAVMSAESGLRGGAGLVTLACPQTVQPGIASRLTEVMTAPLLDDDGELSLQAFDDLLALVADKQALAIGPGLGCGPQVQDLIQRFLRDTSLPVVIDADGLNALCGQLPILHEQWSRQVVLTPHPGEMARLTDLSVEEIQADRFKVCHDFAMQNGVTLVLKGARTLVASPEGRVCINTTGHTGLASGGMGDVLTGLIGSFLAQGLNAFNAAVLGVYLHGLTADRLLPEFGNAGLLATDVMREIPAARQALEKEL